MRPLFAHQHDALRRVQGQERMALFMEMRLGKTAVAIRWAQHHKCSRVLVLGPVSVLPGWQDELSKEGVRQTDIYMLEGPCERRVTLAKEIDVGWALCNYEALIHVPQLLALPWSAIIADESTRIRNPKAKVTKLMLTRTGHIMCRAILSGLPAPESPLDYFCQLAFVYGSFMDCYHYWAFRYKYFQKDFSGYTWEPKRGVVEVMKQEVHKSAVVMTRKMASVGERKVYERREVPMTVEQNKLYNVVMYDFAFKSLQTKWATVRMLWAARLAGGFSPDQEHPELISTAKGKEIIDLLQNELRGEPVVIWFRFNEELRYVSQLLEKHAIWHRAILGETPADKRAAFVHAFQQGVHDVMLMQLKCGKFGMNLSRASTAIYYSNSYDYEDRAQSEDRILHMTKHESLLYIDLVTRRTVDDAVVRTLLDKRITSRTFMTRLVEELRRDYCITHDIKTLSTPTPLAATTLAST